MVARQPTLTSSPTLHRTEDPDRKAGSEHWYMVSEALHSRLRGSVTDTLDELARVYPSTWTNYSPRPVAWVSWIARQQGSLYTDEPTIDYLDPKTGKPLDVDVVKEIRRYRREAKVTESFLAAHEEMVAPGNGVVWVEPVMRGTEVTVECRSVPAHLQKVHLANRPSSKDERDVTTWWLRLPVPGTSGTGLPMDGIVRVTATEAVWEEADLLSGQAFWPTLSGEGVPTNPIGEVPAVVLRWNEPEPGCFWGGAREDFLWQGRAIDAANTDMGEGVRHQMFGQWVSRKLPGAGKIKMGFGTIVDLGEEKDASLTCEGAKSDIPGGQATLQDYTRMATASQDGNPAVLIESTAVTAEGKKIEIADRESLRKRHIKQLAAAEQRVYDLMRKWLNFFWGGEVLPDALLVVSYAPPELPQNELQAEQAMALRLQHGQSSEVRERMRRDRCSWDEALERCTKDLEAQGQLLKLRIKFGLVADAKATDTTADKPADKPVDTTTDSAPAKVTAGVSDVQKTALNGAQVQSLQEVVQAVARKELPAPVAREIILAAFEISPEAVDKMLAPLASFDAPVAKAPVVPAVIP